MPWFWGEACGGLRLADQSRCTKIAVNRSVGSMPTCWSSFHRSVMKDSPALPVAMRVLYLPRSTLPAHQSSTSCSDEPTPIRPSTSPRYPSETPTIRTVPSVDHTLTDGKRWKPKRSPDEAKGCVEASRASTVVPIKIPADETSGEIGASRSGMVSASITRTGAPTPRPLPSQSPLSSARSRPYAVSPGR
jgi:hypothetical protein